MLTRHTALSVPPSAVLSHTANNAVFKSHFTLFATFVCLIERTLACGANSLCHVCIWPLKEMRVCSNTEENLSPSSRVASAGCKSHHLQQCRTFQKKQFPQGTYVTEKPSIRSVFNILVVGNTLY